METMTKDIVLSNIISIMESKGMTQVDFINALNEPLPANKQIKARTTFSDWKKRKSFSYLKILPQIAEVLGVSVSSLFEHPDDERAKFELAGLDPEEEEIIQMYRDSSVGTRVLFLNLVREIKQLRQSLAISDLNPDAQYTLIAKNLVPEKSKNPHKKGDE